MIVTTEQIQFAEKLRNYPGVVTNMNPNLMREYLEKAPELYGMRVLFWRDPPALFMIAARNDRVPVQDEFLPIAQLLFEDGDIHLVSETQWSVELCQNSYTEKRVVDTIADAMAATADKDSYSDAFDFDRTDTGKRMQKAAEDKDK